MQCWYIDGSELGISLMCWHSMWLLPVCVAQSQHCWPGIGSCVHHWTQHVTRITQVWVLLGSVQFMVLSSLLTKFVPKILRSLVRGLGPTFPMDLVYICVYLGCTQICSGPSHTTPMDCTKRL